MLGNMRKLNQTGDTIVEVMIVLAVLGLAIGTSYATSSRSLLAARAAQENAEATQAVQTQIEYLKAYTNFKSSDTDHYIYQPTGLFCISTADGKVKPFSGSLTDFSIYPADCVNSYYHIAISYGGAPDDNFTVTAYWDDVQGQGQDSVTMVYRTHPTP
jgi:Tfp pilus assembly protein PilV